MSARSRKQAPVVHMIVVMNGVVIDTWTQDPEGLERSYRDHGAYVTRGGLPQPVATR